jgi:CspA family cold shock protein
MLAVKLNRGGLPRPCPPVGIPGCDLSAVCAGIVRLAVGKFYRARMAHRACGPMGRRIAVGRPPVPTASAGHVAGIGAPGVAPRGQASHIGPVSLVRFGLLSLLVIERRARCPSTLEVRSVLRCRGAALCYERNIAMSIGTVKWFNATKGYGFIQPDDGSKDVFLHISDVERAGIGHPQEGQKLEYELQRGQQGKTSAGNLKLA